MNPKKKFITLRSNNKINIFILFLVLSSVFWFFSTLSDTYISLIDFNLKYTDIPKDLIFQEQPPSTLSTQIKTTGFNIVGYRINKKNFSIPFTKFKHTNSYSYYFLPKHEITLLQKQLTDSQIITFSEDTLMIALGKLKTKKVPIQENTKITYVPGYKLVGKLLINPDSINITGAEKIVDSIHSIQTDFLTLKNINSDFNKTVLLKSPNVKIKLEKKETHISGKIAKFTQGKIEVPVKILNKPKNAEIELFPKKVTINYEITFENYNKITENSFSVICNYQSDKSTLVLSIEKKPEYIKTYSLDPKEVKYLIKK